MTREMTWMGFLATVLIVIVVSFNMLREEQRQEDALIALRVDAVAAGIDMYAENCAICHGAAGEGLGATPPLASAGVREMDYETLFKTIARGRYNTTMAAYSVDEGGIFTDAQIDHLIAMIQYVNWGAVEARVAELGLTPPEMVVMELSDETLQSVRDLPGGETLASGLSVYAAECAACHGANAEGTTLAPALNTDELRARMTDADLARVITNGVPGTLMAAWGGALTPGEMDSVTQLIRRWPEIETAGIELPVIEAEPLDMSPEAIAQGEWLFNLTCSQCHGTGAYGSPMAPALNSQQFLADTPDAAIRQIIAQGVTGTAMPAWGGRLTDRDIDALVAYLRSLEPTAPATANTAPAVPGANVPGAGPVWRRN